MYSVKSPGTYEGIVGDIGRCLIIQYDKDTFMIPKFIASSTSTDNLQCVIEVEVIEWISRWILD